jgi:hypothetical protein
MYEKIETKDLIELYKLAWSYEEQQEMKRELKRRMG